MADLGSAAAASLVDNNDALVARKLQSVEQLTSIFGFETAVAEQAVDYVLANRSSDDDDNDAPMDVTACYNYIIDQGLGQDQGGPVTPIDTCPHVVTHCCVTANQLPLQPFVCTCTHVLGTTSTTAGGRLLSGGFLKSETANDGVTCEATENWLCLECGVVRCSRYCNGHAAEHFEETKPTTTATKESLDQGHCIAISLSDLSVWCYVCHSYLSTSTGSTGKTLQPVAQLLEDIKFGSSEACSILLLEPERKRHKQSDDEGEPDNQMETEQDNDSSSSSEKHDENSESSDESESDETEDSDDDDEALIQRLTDIAAARGIPLEWLILQAQTRGSGGDDGSDDDDKSVEYPFASLPTSLADVAKFMLSDQCRSILVLAGAGMSVASGIPDFRSADGLYATLDADLLTADRAEKDAIRSDPTMALDQTMFLQNPLPCLELQKEFILGTRSQRWKATLAHRFIELLHTKTGKLVRHYTQNIDGLEDQCTQLPRDKVIAVHGSMDRAECGRCHSEANFDDFCDRVQTQIKDLTGNDADAPKQSTPIECEICGYAAMKPSIVLFRSSLPKIFFESVPKDIADVDLLIVIGTSLRVAPANSLVYQVPKSAMRVLVNREEAGSHLGLVFDGNDVTRDYFAQGECDDVLLELMDHLGWLNDLKPLLPNGQLPDFSARLLEAYLRDRAGVSSDFF